MRKSEQARNQLFLPKALAERFEQLAATPGASRSRLLDAAVEAWLDRRSTDRLEQRFARRLGRNSRQLLGVDRDGHLSLESVALFVRRVLTLNAPLPEGGEAAGAIRRGRFAAIATRAGQQLASGPITLLPEEPR